MDEIDADTVVIFKLSTAVGDMAAAMLKEVGLTKTSDLISLLGSAMAWAQAYGVSQGADLDATIKGGARLVENVTRALAMGQKPRFDA
jgi:hypothetical protein